MVEKHIKVYTFIFIIFTLILFSSMLYVGESNFILLIYINFLIIVYIVFRKYDLKLLTLIIIQWLIYFIFLIIHKYFVNLIGSGNDDIRFEKLAINFYNYYLYGIKPDIFQNSILYSQILGVVYYLGGYNDLIPGLINISIHSITIILLYKIYILVLKTKKGSILTCALYTFYPLTMFNTIITLREIVIIAIIMIFVYTFLLFYVFKKNIYLLLNVLSLVVGTSFHIGLLGLIIFYIIYITFFTNLNKIIKVFSVLLFIITSRIYLATTENTKIVNNISDKNKDFDKSISRADYLIPGSSSGFINDLIFKLKQEVFFIAKPFIWEIRGFADLTGFLNTTFILLGILLGIYIYIKSKNKRIIILLVMVLSIYFVFALGTYNYGTALRHRDKGSMLLTLFIPYFYYFNRKKRSGYNGKNT
ncbi:hypothetical protein [Mammaliicoccus sciuri]|uniref:hypothetical protein n=1 Tax=Mammaliicoccus sciuri TaxID=1296 RepID=UPI0028844F23|nr:hypothetical protein [Mammaliicoccus sciuri]MDT0695300.1 hypothetical protein [Mammaliicoccus sciuri]